MCPWDSQHNNVNNNSNNNFRALTQGTHAPKVATFRPPILHTASTGHCSGTPPTTTAGTPQHSPCTPLPHTVPLSNVCDAALRLRAAAARTTAAR